MVQAGFVRGDVEDNNLFTARFAFGRDGDDLIQGTGDYTLLFGQAGDDTLVGGRGTDFLYGGSGDDTLYGGEGLDFLYGGDGADRFIVTNETQVRDFDTSEGDEMVVLGTDADQADLIGF